MNIAGKYGVNRNYYPTESYYGNAYVIVSDQDDNISKGYAFQVHRRVVIPSEGKKIVLDFSGVTDKFLFTSPLKMRTDAGQVFIDTYKIEEYTGGNAYPSINRDDTSLNAADGVVKEGIISTDVAGDDKREYIVGELAAFRNPGGGTGGGEHPKKWGNRIIVLDVENREGTEINLEINVNWYEIPEDGL